MNKHKRVKHSAFNLCMKVANFTRALNLENGKKGCSSKLERFDNQAKFDVRVKAWE